MQVSTFWGVANIYFAGDGTSPARFATLGKYGVPYFTSITNRPPFHKLSKKLYFFVCFQSTNFSWNFTYVPNNQNERVYVPQLYLNPPAHMTPTYLYVREPAQEFSTRNGSTDGTRITVQVSLLTFKLVNNCTKICYLSHCKKFLPIINIKSICGRVVS